MLSTKLEMLIVIRAHDTVSWHVGMHLIDCFGQYIKLFNEKSNGSSIADRSG